MHMTREPFLRICYTVFYRGSALFFCSKCARCILSIEFHQLSDQDAFKLAFRAALECIPSRLNGLAVSQRFIALSTLTYHQWSHPTLMALMKGEAVDEQTGSDVHITFNNNNNNSYHIRLCVVDKPQPTLACICLYTVLHSYGNP